VGGGVPHELGFLPLYSLSDSRLPILGRNGVAYLGSPDSESGEFYVQNVRREIPYNFVIEEFFV
jgi:hypothetical protein